MSDNQEAYFSAGRELLTNCQTEAELAKVAQAIKQDESISEDTRERLRPVWFSVHERLKDRQNV